MELTMEQEGQVRRLYLRVQSAGDGGHPAAGWEDANSDPLEVMLAQLDGHPELAAILAERRAIVAGNPPEDRAGISRELAERLGLTGKSGLMAAASIPVTELKMVDHVPDRSGTPAPPAADRGRLYYVHWPEHDPTDEDAGIRERGFDRYRPAARFFNRMQEKYGAAEMLRRRDDGQYDEIHSSWVDGQGRPIPLADTYRENMMQTVDHLASERRVRPKAEPPPAATGIQHPPIVVEFWPGSGCSPVQVYQDLEGGVTRQAGLAPGEYLFHELDPAGNVREELLWNPADDRPLPARYAALLIAGLLSLTPPDEGEPDME